VANNAFDELAEVPESELLEHISSKYLDYHWITEVAFLVSPFKM
jgi:hypothetical protein